MSKRPALRSDLIGGWTYAVGFSAIAAIPLVLLGALSLAHGLRGMKAELSLLQWLLVCLAVFGSYFVAATVAAVAFWLTRPLRPGLLGYVLSGIVITPIVYGSIAFCAYVAWEPEGRFFFGNNGETPQSFLAGIPGALGFFAVVGIPFGLVFWWRSRSRAG